MAGAGAGPDLKPIAAYTIGRFQPPTLGHVRMIRTMLDLSKGAPTFVFISAVKTYMPSDLKKQYLRKMLFENGEFPENLTLVDVAECEDERRKRGAPQSCGGPLGGFGYLKDKGLVGPRVLLFVGGDRLEDFDPKTADMWSKVPVEERPTIQALPREGTGVATYSSTLARTAVLETGRVPPSKNVSDIGLAKYLRDRTTSNAITDSDIRELNNLLYPAVVAAKEKEAKKRGGGEDDSVLDDDLDGGGRKRRRTKRNKASGKALSRRGSRSRSGSSRTIRSSYGSRGYSKGSNTW